MDGVREPLKGERGRRRNEERMRGFRKLLIVSVGLLTLALGTATVSSANTLVFSGTSVSNTDLGTVTLDLYSTNSGDYLVDLSWDNSTLTNNLVTGIDAVSVKITSDTLTTSNSDLTGVPSGTTWQYYPDANATNNCGGNQGGGACAALTGGSLVLSGLGYTGPYTWQFTIDGSVSLIPSSEFSSQVNFVKANGQANISTTFSDGGGGTDGQTPVPEPASLVLLGTGLAFAANRLRRKRA